MALTEQVQLDIQNAQRQIDALERQLEGLSTPVNIPVEVRGEQKLAEIRRDLGLSENAVEGLNEELDDTERSLRDAGRAADRTGDEIETAGRRGSSAFQGMGKSILGFAAALGAIQGARAFLDFAKGAVAAASDLEESTSKATVVFGEFFDEIEAFASTAPQALGLANAQALEFTGTFGNLFVALGLSQQAAADLAPQIVQLGADLASFNNLEVTDALDKLRAGLVGEAEPLRALGVNLTAASTEAKALELGLGGVSGEVSEAAKVQARYALILEQTTTAQGDFARTSDGIANQQRTLAGEFENVRASIGEALLPAFQALLEVAPDLVSALEQLGPALGTAAAQFGNFVTEGAGVVTFLADLPRGFSAVTDVASGFSQAMFNVFQGTAAISTLGLVGDLDDFGNALGELQQTADNINIRIIEQDVIDALRGGIQPIDAFANALGRLQEAGTLDPGSIERFALITGASASEQIRVLSTLRGGLELTDIELAAFTSALREVTGASEGLAPPLGELINGVSQLPPALGPIAGAADDAADGIGRLVAEFAGFDVGDQIAELNRQFGALPDGLDAAAAALRDDENEIITDFTKFLDGLEGELQSRQAFADNLSLLRALGLDDLATVFEEAGLESASALADAIANPAEARRAEALLDEFAGQQATSYIDAFAQSISSEPITQELIDSIIAAAAAADNAATRAALEALAQSLTFQIPATIGIDTAGIRAAIDRGFDVAGNVGQGSPGGGVTVNQTFTEPTTPSTETARAAQSVNSLVNVR